LEELLQETLNEESQELKNSILEKESVKNNQRKLDKENNIRYKCGRCNKDYARKDTLSKHVKNCGQVE